MGKYANQFSGMRDKYIEACHKENFEYIDKFSMEVGGVFQKEDCEDEIIVSIHPIYGWIKTNLGDSQKVPQSPADAMENGWQYIKDIKKRGEV